MDLWFYIFLNSNSSHIDQDDMEVVLKGCVIRNPIYDWKDICLPQVSNLDPLDQ